jgi:hypothetical protein
MKLTKREKEILLAAAELVETGEHEHSCNAIQGRRNARPVVFTGVSWKARLWP